MQLGISRSRRGLGLKTTRVQPQMQLPLLLQEKNGESAFSSCIAIESESKIK